MKFNFDIFFKEYRIKFGDIKSAITVENIKLIIEAHEKYAVNINQLAYILATAYHETGHDFFPKYEYGKYAYFIKKYWLNSKVAKWLGNDNELEAFKYRGRGLVQITGETNYERFGIADNPDKALEIATAIEIIYVGMTKGIFTGKDLYHYIGKYNYDFLNARRIINGLDKAKLIAGYAEAFREILNKSLEA
ncbi:MAG TPA: hypothetical protein PLS10_07100 [Chitinophagales bacterium]|nr:hypothetical protein [Chitinophagales bacterium]